jgi:hypothetical protein
MDLAKNGATPKGSDRVTVLSESELRDPQREYHLLCRSRQLNLPEIGLIQKTGLPSPHSRPPSADFGRLPQ